jgi:hypothetical protein
MEHFGVFYSFHYEDVSSFKANIIRNSSKLKCYQGLLTDKSIWEAFKIKTQKEIKKRIDESELVNSDATIVLIGEETHNRKWVKYEIIKSFEAGNTLIGININKIKGRDENPTKKGRNPFELLAFKYDKEKDTLYFYELINRSWKPFTLLPYIKNDKKNSIYVKDRTFGQWLRGESKEGKRYKLSDFFEVHTWKQGQNNARVLHEWLNESHKWITV